MASVLLPTEAFEGFKQNCLQNSRSIKLTSLSVKEEAEVPRHQILPATDMPTPKQRLHQLDNTGITT